MLFARPYIILALAFLFSPIAHAQGASAKVGRPKIETARPPELLSRQVSPSSLTSTQLELYTSSMNLAAQAFDAKANLIRRPVLSHSNAQGAYMVRESSWYALGLLIRDGKGDRELAASVLRTVLANQYRTPDRKWYGTFKRSPEEPTPRNGDLPFTSYDPNWRQFLGTTFQIILSEYPDRIPSGLRADLEESIQLAVLGEFEDGRLKESYSNIALMYGVLWEHAALTSPHADWTERSRAWNAEVYRLFREHSSFFEYNSPTYYGVDLYALGMWVRYGSTSATRQTGEIMQKALWRDIADFYNPLLRNISGPYDRSYGMDMEQYVSVVGVWLRSVLPQDQAPLPKSVTLGTDHVADLWFAPSIAVLGTDIPPDAMAKFKKFSGNHLVTKQIDASRVATASISRRLMFGGEVTGGTKDAGAGTQFHPATVQWRTPAGSVGWIQLEHAPALEALADKGGITVTTNGNVDFLIDADGLDPAGVGTNTWTLPGLRVRVATDGTTTTESKVLPNGENGIAVHFLKATRIRLDLEETP